MGCALDPDHPTGRDKARVFAALGFTQDSAALLMVQLRRGVRHCPALPRASDQYGSRYSQGVPRGTLGTVVYRFAHPAPACEVEFCDDQGRTLTELALHPDQITPAGHTAAA